jgi:hypothetical protein
MIDAFGYSGERSLRLNHSDVARKRYADLRLSDSHWRDDEFFRELGENTVSHGGSAPSLYSGHVDE